MSKKSEKKIEINITYNESSDVMDFIDALGSIIKTMFWVMVYLLTILIIFISVSSPTNIIFIIAILITPWIELKFFNS